MIASQFNIKKITQLSNLIVRFRDGESAQVIQDEFDRYFKEENIVTLLLITQEVFNGGDGITTRDMEVFTANIIPLVANELPVFHSNHPVSIFLKENEQFMLILNQIERSLATVQQAMTDNDTIEELQEFTEILGSFQKHYHRKQKLFFPILERYGHYTPTRVIWRRDDRAYALYQSVKKQISLLPETELEHIKKTFKKFAYEFKAMIYQEESILLPILAILFTDKDWQDIANESDAYGFALTDMEPSLTQKGNNKFPEVMINKNIPFSSGYLTVKEADLILNNLPVEITFVDNKSIFKYFNNMTKSSDMMFIRTPISLGRNVGNCHPPKSLKKVMSLVRDLKTGKRTSESMWFKKEDKYIHITYKALFDEQDEFMGILEYVQDIQSFLNLPSETKTNLTKLDD